MSAGGEKASRRVEILAIVVGGVVGLAGILVTLASSRDAQKATENAQRISARATRERADLTELRSVLDRAVVDLRTVQAVVQDLLKPAEPGSEDRVQGRKRMRSTVRGAQSDLARMQIRLEAAAPGPAQYRNAIRAYRCAGIPLTYRFPGDRCPAKPASEYFVIGNGHMRGFIKEARELARSRLPPDSP